MFSQLKSNMQSFILLLGLVAWAGAQDASIAEVCNATTTCLPPDCRCVSTDAPGGLRIRDVPQFVTLAFTGAINVLNIETYRSILYNRVNSGNNCPIGATFFINHNYNNYQLVNELHLRNYEIGLSSISSRFPSAFWANASYENLVEELIDQRLQISHFSNIPQNNIQGVRLPFLQMSGDTSFQVMRDNGLMYDFSWPSVTLNNPPIWPYTLDYASTQDCPIGPCPSDSFPGVWVQPLVAWIDLEGNPCATPDACYYVPDHYEDEDGWYSFFVQNFERHYLNNRAPFPFHINEGFISGWPTVRRAYIRFLNLLNSLPDVFVVNASQVIDWIKNPVPIDVYKTQPCRAFASTFCTPRNCGNYVFDGITYNLQVCNVCPDVYPWVGNPLGVN